MSAAWGHTVGIIILLLLLSFIGIWIWAWLPFHKGNFDALARLPLRDDDTRATVDEGGLQ
jgi:cytochrome c oxidase cbb3-type subunit 4